MKSWLWLFVSLVAVPFASAIYPGHVSSPSAWQQSAWVVDYGQSTGKANDSNDCASAATPCKSFAAVAARNGCLGLTLCSHLSQATSLTFLSDDPEPIVIDDQAFSGGSLVVQGTGTVIGSVSLSSLVPKNYAPGSNALLAANLGAGAAVGSALENQTHPSRAWAYKATGGTSFALTQPLALESTTQSTWPARVDTWANSDAVNLVAYPRVNLLRVRHLQSDWNGSRSNPLVLYHLVVSDPNGAGSDDIDIGPSVLAIETQFERSVLANGGASGNAFAIVGHDTGQFGYPQFLNCQFLGGFASLGSFGIIGGSVQGGGANIAAGAGEAFIDADFIFGGVGFLTQGIIGLGTIYLDANLVVGGGTDVRAIDGGHGYGDQIWYGNATAIVQLAGNGRIENHDQTFTEAFTLASLVNCTPGNGFQMNRGNLGSSTACSHTGGSPDVRYCGIVPCVANLDAPAGPGGFGLHAESFSGASISFEP